MTIPPIGPDIRPNPFEIMPLEVAITPNSVAYVQALSTWANTQNDFPLETGFRIETDEVAYFTVGRLVVSALASYACQDLLLFAGDAPVQGKLNVVGVKIAERARPVQAAMLDMPGYVDAHQLCGLFDATDRLLQT